MSVVIVIDDCVFNTTALLMFFNRLELFSLFIETLIDLKRHLLDRLERFQLIDLNRMLLEMNLSWEKLNRLVLINMCNYITQC